MRQSASLARPTAHRAARLPGRAPCGPHDSVWRRARRDIYGGPTRTESRCGRWTRPVTPAAPGQDLPAAGWFGPVSVRAGYFRRNRRTPSNENVQQANTVNIPMPHAVVPVGGSKTSQAAPGRQEDPVIPEGGAGKTVMILDG